MPASFELRFCFESWFGDAAEVVEELGGDLFGVCSGEVGD